MAKYDDVMNDYDAYIEEQLGLIDLDKLRPYRVLINTGNGKGGPMINAFEKHLPFDIVKLNNIPDATYPFGAPDLGEAYLKQTAEAVRKEDADLGVAFNADMSDVRFFDEKGNVLTAEAVDQILEKGAKAEEAIGKWLVLMAQLSLSEGKTLSELAK